MGSGPAADGSSRHLALLMVDVEGSTRMWQRDALAAASMIVRFTGLVADVVADAEVTAALAGDLTAWADCLAGAITRVAYRHGLERAGFVEISVTDSHPVADGFASAIVRAVKPPAGGAN